MKRLLFAALPMFFFFQLQGQQDTMSLEELRAILSGQKTGTSNSEKSSTSTGNTTASNNMEAAVSPALYVITQDYYLKKDNLRYGKTSNTPWGTATGFAVNIGGQLYTTASILRAWEYDAQYKAKGFNGGAFGALKYRRVLATDASEKMGAELKTDIAEGKLTGFYKDLSGVEKGLATAQSAQSEGWLLVWFCGKNENPLEAALSRKMIRVTPKWDGESGEIPSPSISGKIIGGVFLQEDVVTGAVRFLAAGLYQEKDGRASIAKLSGIPLSNGSNSSNDEPPPVKADGSSDEPVPVAAEEPKKSGRNASRSSKSETTKPKKEEAKKEEPKKEDKPTSDRRSRGRRG